jgi:hypothetical protein
MQGAARHEWLRLDLTSKQGALDNRLGFDHVNVGGEFGGRFVVCDRLTHE